MTKFFFPLGILIVCGVLGRYYILVINTLFFLSFLFYPMLVAPISKIGFFMLDSINAPLFLLTLWITALIVMAREHISLDSSKAFVV